MGIQAHDQQTSRQICWPLCYLSPIPVLISPKMIQVVETTNSNNPQQEKQLKTQNKQWVYA